MYYLKEIMDLRGSFEEAYNSKRYADAIDSGERIRELYRENDACASPGYADDINNLAIVYDDVNIHDKAKDMYREAARAKKALWGEDCDSYMDTVTNLGVLLSSEGEFEEAEGLLKRVNEYEAKNSDSIRHMRSLYNLGNMYADKREYQRAIKTLDDTLLHAKAISNLPESEYADIHISLADVCGRYGNYRRARDEYESAFRLFDRVGDDGSGYFRMTSYLTAALVYQKCGKYERAAEIYEKAVETRERLMDIRHLDFVSVLNNLAVIYNKAGENEKAWAVHMRVLGLVEEILGKNHVFYGDVLTNLGVDKYAMGDLDAALRYHNEALDVKKSIVGEKHIHYIWTLVSLAEIYEKAEKYDRAADIQNTALELKRECIGEIHEQIAESLVSLGRIYMKMGDNLRAQGFFMQALIISKEIMEKENITVNGYGENIRLMAQTCANRGDRDKTESFAESLIAYRKAAKGDRHPRYAAALYESAMLMIEVGNYSRAEEYLTGASEITETMLGNDTEPCRSCLCELCRVLYIQKKYEQAADRIKKAVSLCRKYDDEKRLVDIMFLQAEIQYCLGYKRKAEEIAFRIDNMVLRSGDNRQLYLEKQAEYIRLMLDGGDYARAAERLKAACGSIEDEGNKAEYFGMLAEAHFGNGDYAQALDAAEECLKYERDEAKRCGAYIIKAASGLKVGKYAMANEVLSETLFTIEKNTELYKKYAAQTYCLMAEGYYMSSEASSAADCLEMGLKKAKETESLPMDEYLRYLKLAADISVRISRYDRAVEYLSEAALILRRDGGEDGDFADMLMKTAETYMLSRRFSDAEAMYKRAAEIFDALSMVDEGVDAELGVCNALSEEGRYEALAERIEKMKAYGNRNGEFSRLLALAYKNTGALGRLMRLKIGKGL